MRAPILEWGRLASPAWYIIDDSKIGTLGGNATIWREVGCKKDEGREEEDAGESRQTLPKAAKDDSLILYSV